MALLLIINTADPIEGIFKNLPKLEMQDIIYSPTYNVDKLMEAAKEGNELADQEVRKILVNSNNVGQLLGVNTAKVLYAFTGSVIIIDGAFYTSEEIDFVTTTLESKYSTVIVNYDTGSDNIMLINPKFIDSKVYVNKDEITVEDVIKVAFFKHEELNKDMKSLRKVDRLLQEVSKELDSMTHEPVNPLNLTLEELTKHLNTEWNEDRDLKTLPLRDILKLLGLVVVKEEE